MTASFRLRHCVPSFFSHFGCGALSVLQAGGVIVLVVLIMVVLPVIPLLLLPPSLAFAVVLLFLPAILAGLQVGR
jgi:hypothetical protein